MLDLFLQHIILYVEWAMMVDEAMSVVVAKDVADACQMVEMQAGMVAEVPLCETKSHKGRSL